VCEVSMCSTPNSRHSGSQAKAGDQSIRWKASRVEAASSLHWGGVRAALAVWVFSGNVVEKATGSELLAGAQALVRMSRRSRDRRRESGVLVKTTRTTSSRRMVSSEGARRRQGMSEVGGFRGEGSPSGNNARRVSVQEHRKVRLQREPWLVKRARVRSMGSVARPIHGEAKRASRTVVPKLARLTTTPILRDPRDANHAGSIVKDITANR